jgi:hypothetical protein
MATAYVYAPKTGTNMGQTCYCDNPNCVCPGCVHTVVRKNAGWVSPIDISSNDGLGIYIYATSIYIKSIRTEQVDWICQNTSLVPWTYGVVVDLYKNTNGTGYVGSVMYGHLENRIPNGFYTSHHGLRIGTTPDDDCNCGCYDGHHVHMQRRNGSSNTFGCGATLYAGTTWIFKWTV